MACNPTNTIPEMRTIVWELAKDQMKSRLFSTTKDMNAINRALENSGFDWAHAIWEGKHVADMVAKANIKAAQFSTLEKALKRHQKLLSKAEAKRLERLHKGRTRGAGAGGFNRDIERIKIRIDIERDMIEVLSHELAYRKLGVVIRYQINGHMC